MIHLTKHMSKNEIAVMILKVFSYDMTAKQCALPISMGLCGLITT